MSEDDLDEGALVIVVTPGRRQRARVVLAEPSGLVHLILDGETTPRICGRAMVIHDGRQEES